MSNHYFYTFAYTARGNMQKFTDYIAGLDWQRGTNDEQIFNSLLRAASLGLSAKEAKKQVRIMIRQCGGEIKHYQINKKWNQACVYIAVNAHN